MEADERNPVDVRIGIRQVRVPFPGGYNFLLSIREGQLLKILARSPGAYFSRSQLMEEMYSHGSSPKQTIITDHIFAIRQKTRNNPKFIILTKYGVGYTLHILDA